MNLKTHQKLARAKKKENIIFLNRLGLKRPKDLDDILQKLSDEYDWDNCLNCGNCCRGTGPMLLPRDISRISSVLRIKERDFELQYLHRDEDNDMVFKCMPCPFLGEENHCAVYDDRPKACREYPHSTHPDFYKIRELTIKNIDICPALFEIIEKLKTRLPL